MGLNQQMEGKQGEGKIGLVEEENWLIPSTMEKLPWQDTEKENCSVDHMRHFQPFPSEIIKTPLFKT